MSIGGIIAGVGALAGGIIGGNAAEHAADASANAARQASDVQLQMYNQTREDLAPQREAQRYALDALLSMTGLPGLTGAKPTTPSEVRTLPVWANGRGSVGTLGSLANFFRGGRNSSYGPGNGGMGGTGFGELEFSTVPSLHDILSRRNPEPRLLGGPLQQGRSYTLSEMGHPEGVYDSAGTLQQVSTTPQTVVAQQDGYVKPMIPGMRGGGPGSTYADLAGPTGATGPSPTGLPGIPPDYTQVGNPIPGSSVLENPGGQPGRYNFMADPGYGFRFDEGARGVERSAAAKGLGLSGSVLKALTRYGQGIASDEYSNVYNRIANIAGLGQTGQSLTAQAGMNSAAQQGGYLQAIGNANAAGTLGRGSAYGDTLSQLARLYGQGAFGGGGGSGSGVGSDVGGIAGYDAPFTWNWDGGP